MYSKWTDKEYRRGLWADDEAALVRSFGKAAQSEMKDTIWDSGKEKGTTVDMITVPYGTLWHEYIAVCEPYDPNMYSSSCKPNTNSNAEIRWPGLEAGGEAPQLADLPKVRSAGNGVDWHATLGPRQLGHLRRTIVMTPTKCLFGYTTISTACYFWDTISNKAVSHPFSVTRLLCLRPWIPYPQLMPSKRCF